MIPNIERGTSFKGVTAYLVHDKREGDNDGTTAERVGFCHVMNFIGDEARDPEEASKLMALTVRDADLIKLSAGIKPGGRKAEKPPVWHASLSWHPSETVSEQEMLAAVDGCLSAVGLSLDKGYQTYVVQHTDEPQAHVHIVVNLVHPTTGKQANPYRDLPKAQEWGRQYDKRRGTIFAHDREAKYAALDAARSKGPVSAAFNDRARGGSAPPGDRPPTSRPKKGQQRSEWESRQSGFEAARQAADGIRAANDARYHAMRSDHGAAFAARRAEFEQAAADTQAGRAAVLEKYRSAIDAVWKPEAGPKRADPDREAWRQINQVIQTRQTDFEVKEQSLFGRLQNARRLVKGGNVFRVLRLALDAGERRTLFERDQRRVKGRLAPKQPAGPKDRPRPVTPEPKRVQAERLKAMRAAELAAFARARSAAAAAMAARHAFQQQREADERAAFTRNSKAAWAAHRAAYPYKPAEPVKAAPKDKPADKPERPADRYGRSRDRKPRQPRQGRGGDQTGAAERDGRTIDARAENLAADASQTFSPPTEAKHPEPTQQAPREPGRTGQAEEPRGWTPEERAAKIKAEAERQAAREAEEDHDLDPGREYQP